jgi:hypothetical protein
MLLLAGFAVHEADAVSWMSTAVASLAGLAPATAISYLVIR